MEAHRRDGLPFVSVLVDPTYGGVSASYAMQVRLVNLPRMSRSFSPAVSMVGVLGMLTLVAHEVPGALSTQGS